MRVTFGFIPFPLVIVDDGINLSLVEYRLLGYLLRHRFRVKSEAMRLTQDELLRGAFGPNGERRDGGCRITSPRDLKRAREALQALGWLIVHETPDGMVYELSLDGDEGEGSNTPGGLAPASPAASPAANPSEADSAKCTQAPGTEESAKCTQLESAKCTQADSAFCSVSQCNLSGLTVQNAPEDIRKKRENREVVQKPCADSETCSPELVGSETENRQPQEPPCEENDVPVLTLVAGPPASGADPRHAKCREVCRQYAEHAKVAFVWDGSEGNALTRLLKSAPGLTLEQFAQCVRNRAKSDVAHGERPRVWLSTLTNFQAGPLDRFGKPKGGSDANGRRSSAGTVVPGSRDAQRSAGNVAAARRAFEALTGGAA